MRVLVVEDDKSMRQMLVKRMEEQYNVDSTGDGEEAMDYLASYTYDLVLLDIMLPGKDGLSILEDLRVAGNTVPVIMLTAKDTVADRVSGLDLGVDDYLVKPFAFEELQARIRVVLRRRSNTAGNELRVGDLVVDITAQRVVRAGKELDLTRKEYDLLVYMMSHTGIILTRSQLEQSAWNDSFTPGSNIVDVYIRYLRQKVDEGFDYPLIHTVRGRGYCLERR